MRGTRRFMPARVRFGLAVLAAVVAATAAAALLPESTTAAAQSLTEDGYRPCDAATQTVDLLLMMDESGSLNGPDGADPDGEQRRSALKQIRSDLSKRPEVHVALIGFDVERHLHAPSFAPAAADGAQHPADTEIEAAMGNERYTDYGVALEAAAEVFEQARPGSCRVLVWFTDGLHDPVRGLSGEETRTAEELRGRLCGAMKQRFEDKQIQTFAVLLGAKFQRGLAASNLDQQGMAEVSMDVIRGFTGHLDSPVVAGVPTSSDCRHIRDRAGEILTVANVLDLPNRLIEPTLTGFRDWSDCERLRDGSRVTSGELPASAFIEEIQVLAYGGEISRYRLLDSAQADAGGEWRPMPAGSRRRLTLDSGDMEGLPAGWSIGLEVSPDESSESGNVTLDCYSRPVAEPLRMHASVIDGEGTPLGELAAGASYTLRVDMWPYECPLNTFVLVAEYPTTPIRSRACEQGQHADFDYPSGTPDGVTRVERLEGGLEPRFAENLWGRQAELDAEVVTDFTVLPPPPATTTTTAPPPPPEPQPPTLECTETTPRVEGEWQEGAFSGRVIASECRVNLPADGAPTEGAGTVEVAAPSGDVAYHLETADGTRITGQLGSDDLPEQFRVVSDPLAPQGPWDLDGEVQVTLSWQLPDGPAEPQAERIVVPPLSVPVADPPTLECSESSPTLVNADDGEVPVEPLGAVATCTAIGPGIGTLVLSATWSADSPGDASGSGLPKSLDWRFAAGPDLAGDGSTLRLGSGERLAPLEFVSTGPLSNTRLQGAGSLTVEAVWHLPWSEQRVIAQEDLRLELDLRARSNPWLAALMALIAAVLTYTMLYTIMARSNQLPPAGNFFATRLEFATQPRPTGLHSTQLENFSLDDVDMESISGSRRQLRVFDLRIDAEHPRWRQVTSILNGGWGRPAVAQGSHSLSARPPGPASQPGTTAGQFDHLIVIALKAGDAGATDTPDGVAYLLVPKRPGDRRFESRNLTELLRTAGTRLREAPDPGTVSTSDAQAQGQDASPPGRSASVPDMPAQRPNDTAPKRRDMPARTPRDGPPSRSSPPPRPRPRPDGGPSDPPPRRREPPPRRPRRPR